MINPASSLELLLEKADGYTMSTLELLQLQAIDKVAEILTTLVARLAVITSIILAILIINIGIALWIGKLMGDSFYGFFTVGIFYLGMALLLHIFQNIWIKKPIRDIIITHMVKQKTE